MRPVVLLPGILLPGSIRYQPLLAELGDDRRCLVKELEVYGGPAVPPPGYSLDAELDGIDRFADEAGLAEFHLYGHSGGGACALAYVARSPGRVLSLAVDEPATDFSDEDLAHIAGPAEAAEAVAHDDPLAAFVATLLRPGVEPPPPPEPRPPWMADRPAGIAGFRRAILGAEVDRAAWARFDRPVYYSFGSLSHERWEAMAARLESCFPDYTSERFEGLHHLRTSHVAEPARVASRLTELWARAE